MLIIETVITLLNTRSLDFFLNFWIKTSLTSLVGHKTQKSLRWDYFLDVDLSTNHFLNRNIIQKDYEAWISKDFFPTNYLDKYNLTMIWFSPSFQIKDNSTLKFYWKVGVKKSNIPISNILNLLVSLLSVKRKQFC